MGAFRLFSYQKLINLKGGGEGTTEVQPDHIKKEENSHRTILQQKMFYDSLPIILRMMRNRAQMCTHRTLYDMLANMFNEYLGPTSTW